jgi:L-aspartate oxidase
MTDETTDVLVVGSGIAGLSAALGAARAGSEVTVATKATRPEDAASWWAQGGIAVSRDDPERFAADVLAASDGTADPEAVEVLVSEANDAVRDVLIDTLGVAFDTAGETDAAETDDRGASDAPADGRSVEYDFTREAAHDDERILHVDASTGKHVHVPLLRHLAAHDRVTVREDTAALELVTHEGRVHGALLERDGEVWPTFAGATVLATGGIGDCYPRSTNPPGATGDGLAMAALAGADVTDAEFVQFHPTAFAPEDADAGGGGARATGDAPDAGTLLLSEAIRGEGGLLRNADGERFMPGYHPDAELAPRDVVARAVAAERDRTGRVTLDVSPLDFAADFPDLADACRERGVDPAEGIPVAPAEHFLCGGIDVDARGRASLDRLYAVGECARTGVHGANRLASTSLLEGLVWGLRAGADAAGRSVEAVDAPDPRDSDPALPDAFAREKFRRLRRVMGEYVGLERDPAELARAQSTLRRLKGEVDAYLRTRTARSLYELRNATVTGLLVTRAAAENGQSVGTHHLVEGTPAPEAD